MKCCQNDVEEIKIRRKAERKSGPTFIDTVIETRPCHYVYTVCALSACIDDTSPIAENQENRAKELEHQQNSPQSVVSNEKTVAENENERESSEDVEEIEANTEEEVVIVNQRSNSDKKISEISDIDQLLLREKVREMFYHGYDSYMKYAFPQVSLTHSFLTLG